MSLPVRTLPVMQNWDCHVSGNCCKQYHVAFSDEEKQRIEGQGWAQEAEFQGLPIFKRQGTLGARRFCLNTHADGSCIFLSKEGRCRIHERFGFAAKPLPCRLYPFILVPVGDHYRVGLRFACPSAAANRGRPLTAHRAALHEFAELLEKREGVASLKGGRAVPPPLLQLGQRVDWPELLCFVEALQQILGNATERLERRLRKCLALAKLCRQAHFEKVKGARFREFLDLVMLSLDADVPADPTVLPPPTWIGRILFRQALALFTRKERGPNRGPDTWGRLRLLRAAWRFAQGRGEVPRLHAWSPQTTFERAEAPAGPLPIEAEHMLERYYLVKVGSVQFCGVANFGMSFWTGLECLLLTYPLLMWLRRGMADLPGETALMRALSIIDDNFGYHPLTGVRRQQLSFRLLGWSGELERLIAWYGRVGLQS